MINTSQPLSYYDVPDPQRVQEAYTGAMQIVHQRTEADKQRKWEDEHKKPVPFKLDKANAPYAKDQEEISNHAFNAWNNAKQGKDYEGDNQMMQHVDGMSKAQAKQQTDMEQAMSQNATKWGKAFDPTKFTALKNKSDNEDSYKTRGGTLGEMGKVASDPAEHVNGDVLIKNIHDDTPETKTTYGSTKEHGIVTEKNDFTINARYLADTKDPLLLANGQPATDGSGNKIYKKRPILNAQEALPFAENILANPENRHIIFKQTYRDNEKNIEASAEKWTSQMKDNGYTPTKEEIDSYKDGQVEKMSKEKVADRLFKLEKARIEATTGRTLDEPRATPSGSLTNFKLQTYGEGETKNLVRQRTFTKPDGSSSKSTNTYSYHMPMKNTVPLKDGKLMKVSFGNISGTNETTGRAFATAQTVTGADLNGLNFSFGEKLSKEGKSYIRDVSVSADKNADWYQGIDKVMTYDAVKKAIQSGKDPVIYPWAEVSIPKRKDDFSNLSGKEKADAERTIELSKIPSGELTPEERSELAEKSVKYKEFIDHNVSMNANEIPELNRYARETGHKSISDMLLAKMPTEQRTKFNQVQNKLNEYKERARQEISNPKTQSKVSYSSNEEAGIQHLLAKNKGASREDIITALRKAGKLK